MRELFSPDLDAIADEEHVAEFRRSFALIGADYKRILAALMPRLVALQDRGDSETALKLIAEVKRIVVRGEAAPH
jgi:hypothetical protein